MACANPFSLKQLYSHRGILWNYKDYYIPCNYCLNCRKDKQNYYIDRANYEYKTRLTASFVTFTYDDIWLLARCSVLDSFGHPIFDTDSNGVVSLRQSLNYSDLTRFIDNIRHYIVNHSEIQGVLCQPDFSYIYCGEYGDEFGRPHFHVLFFGLDFAFCKKIIFNQWKYGFIDVLPLLDGGIRYVVKYMDKQLFGNLAALEFDNLGRARPRIRMSVGFGKGILNDNIVSILKNDFTYPVGNGLRRPVSSYWKRLITLGYRKNDSTKSYSYHKKVKDNISNIMSSVYNLKDCSSDSSIREFKISQARIREEKLKIMIRNSGFPVSDYESIVYNKFGFKGYRDSIRQLPVNISRLVAESYRDSLPVYSDVV